MKFSTIMIVFALAFAFASAGCRYNKAGKGAGSGSGDGEGMDISSSSQEGSLSDMSEGKFEDLYTRCTDVNFAPVYFGFDSTVVPQGELGKIDAVAQHLTEKTDRVSNEYNLSLGENRAIIIRNYLVQNGIAADRIQTRSYGEERPAATGSGESVWSLNRRGEFAIYQK